MNSQTTEKFRKSFLKLPEKIQNEAWNKFKEWKINPYKENLKFKKVHSSKEIYSVRIRSGWRALGLKENNEVIWFWIGSHSDYDNLFSKL